MQTDPIGSKDDLDLYAYTGEDPVNKADPSGNGPELLLEPVVLLGAATIGAAGCVATHCTEGLAAAATNAINNSVKAQVAIAAKLVKAISTPASPPPDGGDDKHGNDKSSSKSQHRYEIRDTETGDVKKTGISGQDLNENGTSPRANSQVNAANRAEGEGKYEATVVEANIPGRQAALESEKTATTQLKDEGNSLEWQKRPKP